MSCHHVIRRLESTSYMSTEAKVFRRKLLVRDSTSRGYFQTIRREAGSLLVRTFSSKPYEPYASVALANFFKQKVRMAPRKNKRAGDEIAAASPKRTRQSKKQAASLASPSETLGTESMSQSTDLQLSMNQEVIVIDPDTTAMRKIKRIPNGKEFPFFADGDVYVKLGEDRKYCYQLHSSVLGRASPWFRESFLDKPVEFDDEKAGQITIRSSISIRYELDFTHDFSMGYLFRKVKYFPSRCSNLEQCILIYV